MEKHPSSKHVSTFGGFCMQGVLLQAFTTRAQLVCCPETSKDTGRSVSRSLDRLAETHSCIVALIESRLISPSTRRKLEAFRENVEREMAEAKNRPPNEIAAA
jgi:hypothetical protein